jgi:DNA gyrase subunit A
MARQSKGRSIINLLQMERDEHICAVEAVRDFDEDRFLVTATRFGQVKKTTLKAYSNVRSGGLIATGLQEGDRVIGVAITRGDDEVMLGTAEGQAIRFSEQDVRAMGRTASGVRGINLRDDDYVVDMCLVDPMATLLTVCENGYGKRTNFEEYRLQGRGGYGIINIRATDRNGKVVAMRTIRDADEMMLITKSGMIVRTGAEDLRTIGRATQGVRVIQLREDDELIALARVVTDDSTQAQLPLGGNAKKEKDGGNGPNGG